MDKTTYKKQKAQTEHATIDSMNILIRLEQCEIIDPKLISEVNLVYRETGEISDKVLPPKEIAIDSNCKSYQIKMKLVKYPHRQTREIRKYIELKVSAKFLEKRYFEGINRFTIMEIYNKLMEQKVFYVSRQNFMNAVVNDIDICKNILYGFKCIQSIRHI